MKDYSNLGLNNRLKKGLGARPSNYQTALEHDLAVESTPYLHRTSVLNRGGTVQTNLGAIVDLKDLTGGTSVFTYDASTGAITINGPLILNGTTNIPNQGTIGTLNVTVGTFSGDVTFNGTANRGNLVRLSSQVAGTVATIDFTSGIDSTYDEYVVFANNVVVATDASNLLLRVSTNGGTTFAAGAGNYIHGRATPFGGGGVFSGTNSDTAITVNTDIGNASTEGANAEVYIYSPSGSDRYKRINYISSQLANDGNIVGAYGVGAYTGSAVAINAIRFLMSSGNINTGTFTLYGRRGN